MKDRYYDLLLKLGWRTIPLFNNMNRFGSFYSTENQEISTVVNEEISKKIQEAKPLLIGRHGAVELRAITNIFANDNRDNLLFDSLLYLFNKKARFWDINKSYCEKLCYNAGFFPNDIQLIRDFTQLYISESKKIDIYGASTRVEHLMPKETFKRDLLVTYIKNLEPWFYDEPWTQHLKDRKVLVIYPLKDLILSQYNNKRTSIFKNSKVLPKFDLQVFQSVQTIAGEKSRFNNWFEALEYQKEEILKLDFDFAFVGAGAYGFPLASHIKDMGKQAIHFGGATQLLFGIKGNRWLNWERYRNLMNESWVFPDKNDRPLNSNNIEDNAYW